MIGYYEDYQKRKHKILCKKLVNTGCQTHFHGEMELSYILTGTHEITVNGKTKILKKDDMYYCNPYELHQCHSADGGEHILFTIRPFEYGQFSSLIKAHLPNFMLDAGRNYEIYAILNEIIAGQDKINSLERQGYIGLVLGKILQNYGYSSEKSESYKRFEEILLYIDSHYREPLDRNSLAKEFGYSPTYFSRLFQENFHCGLCQYINNLRYERTLSEISGFPKQKTEIILSNGFNNVQSFYRINRKRKAQYDELKDFHN